MWLIHIHKVVIVPARGDKEQANYGDEPYQDAAISRASLLRLFSATARI